MKSLLFQILPSFLVSSAFSQGIIRGQVQDSQAKGIPYANVLLRSESDSLLIKGAISEETGIYSFLDIPKGEYFIEISFEGYSKSYTPVFSFSGTETLNIEAILLMEDTKSLDEVMVVATKPLFEMEMGKMVINVSSSVTIAGFSAIDLLERSPGVIVNRQNNSMTLAGKNGVIILINGKRYRMPPEAAFQMLAGLNSSDVEKIEILTVPPANYDADGDAGFINVVMKRNNGILGTNGSLTVGQGYGSGFQSNLSLNINHQGPKFSWFGLLTPSIINQVGIWESQRNNNNGFEDVSINSVSNDRNSNRKAVNYQVGFDYYIGKNTTLSALVSGYENRLNMDAPTVTEAMFSTSPDTLVNMILTEKNNWSHIMGNINLHHTFKNGHIISADLDYLTYSNSNPTAYEMDFYLNPNDFLYSEEFRISKETPIDMWVGSANHSAKIGESIKVDSGIKGTFSELNNQVVFEKNMGSEWVVNPTFSNEGLLKEDILAAFSTAAITVNDKTTLNAGLRYEKTKTNLTASTGEVLVNRHYSDLFPSIQFAREINTNSMLTMGLSRRITRPSFNQMAPWVIFSDRYTLFSGNVNILPTYTRNIKGDYSFKSYLISAQYSHDKNSIASFQPSVDEETNIALLRTENIDQMKTISLMLAFPVQPKSWWEIQNSITANYQQVISELDEEAYNVDQLGLEIISNHSFSL